MIDNLHSFQYFHFIGIGGSGMSGLARLLKQQGKSVMGSDEKESSTTLALAEEGITLYFGHDPENIDPRTEVIIYSPAIPESNSEMITAQKKNIFRFSYPQAVGFLTKEKKTICICGTHGKTTTTGLITATLLAANADPTVIIGASLPELKNRNERLGNGPYFVLESCEYRRAFLNFQPSIIILNNIEADHLDYYKDLADYRSAFKEFIEKLPSDGLLIANRDDENVRLVVHDFNKSSLKWFGTNAETDYQLKEKGIYQNGQKIMDLQLKIPGHHNLMNACATVALSSELGLDMSLVKHALENYQGASRRFEYKGKIGKTVIIDDYGHHPTEIIATLKGAREKFGPTSKILCIFQPHQYSRTYKLLADFLTAFKDADEVIIPNILRVRDSEEDLKNITAETLVQKMSEYHSKVSFGHGIAETAHKIQREIQNYDVILTMGAGDVWKISGLLTNKQI